MKTQTTTTQTTKTACKTCLHYRPSFREGGGRGLCMFFRQLMTEHSKCTAGYTPVGNAERTS